MLGVILAIVWKIAKWEKQILAVLIRKILAVATLVLKMVINKENSCLTDSIINILKINYFYIFRTISNIFSTYYKFIIPKKTKIKYLNNNQTTKNFKK